jgi:hypothetical protein
LPEREETIIKHGSGTNPPRETNTTCPIVDEIASGLAAACFHFSNVIYASAAYTRVDPAVADDFHSADQSLLIVASCANKPSRKHGLRASNFTPSVKSISPRLGQRHKSLNTVPFFLSIAKSSGWSISRIFYVA